MEHSQSNKRWWMLNAAAAAILLGVVVAGGVLWRSSHEPNANAADASAPRAAASQPGPTATETAGPKARPAVPVTVAPVTVRSIQRSVEVVGTFHGFDEVTVSPEVAGRVVRIHSDLGDVVHPGDVLMEIDAVDYQLAVEVARREMESDLARIGLTEVPDVDTNVDWRAVLADSAGFRNALQAYRQRQTQQGRFDPTTVPAVSKAIDQMQLSFSKLDRARELYRQRTLSKEDLERAETEHEVDKATFGQMILEAKSVLATARFKQAKLATAEKQLRYTKVLVPQPTFVKAHRPEPATSRATLEAASLATPFTEALAKAEFVVARRMVSEGEMVNAMPPSPAFELVIDQVLKLRAEVPERYVGQVKPGQKVLVSVEAYPGRTFEGTVWRVSPTVDTTSRTFQVEALVLNLVRELKAGGFSKLEILTHVDQKAWTVPLEAVVTFAGSTRIFVVDQGAARAVPITPGITGRGWVELVRPDPQVIAPNTQVILSGHAQLADGIPVRVRE